MQSLKSKREIGSSSSNKRAKISIYDEPPSGDLSLEEFEQFALDRMRVLKAIDSAKAKGVKSEELASVIEQSCKQYLPLRSDVNYADDRRKDNVSHFILRIAYSRTEELRKWFLRQEEILFRHRFSMLDFDGRNFVMSILNARNGEEANIINIDQSEWNEIHEQLNILYGSATVDESGQAQHFLSIAKPWQHIYKVPFEEVPDLVSARKVFLKHGWAYVLSRDVASVVVSNFRLRLSRQLTENARMFYTKAEEEAERLGPLLQNLTNAYLGADFSSGAAGGAGVGRITLDVVPSAMARSAPLCMRSLYDKLRSMHHLKHDARMQLGLFFKGIGVTLEDSLALWREEFTRGGKTTEQFEKGYAYNIRHNYGMEGKRVSYSPYACSRIIGSTPVGDQAHGCPFRHWDESHLAAALQSMRLGSAVVHDVMEKVRGHHYQVACLRVFEATHPGSTVDALNHPNQYFMDSQRHFQAKESSEGAASAAAASAPAAAATTVKAEAVAAT